MELPKIIKDVGFEFSWDEPKVWALDIPVEEIPIKELTWHFSVPFWFKSGGKYDLTPQEVIDNPQQFAEEYQRIKLSDTSHPLDIMLWKGKWLLLDGLHRLVKLYLEEKATVAVRKIPHKDYTPIKIKEKSYWIYEKKIDFKTFGLLRVVVSKEGVHDEPVFFVTNNDKFTAKFIVKLYLKRFSIEVFFKDAKQFLNLETFLCRNAQKWDIHLLLTNVVHWAIQKKNSISKMVRKIQENISECVFFINENRAIEKFFDELRRKCQT
ncbi:MAG: hypothetical protein UT01_C0043G0002 [Candidatus Daviesbacteria bacterium GW2011_GWA1_38_7]|nr:MAG: hypothetical protein UT01_C0043G0002 [Candidatus Daviesbacteria bacterium GW2011_GWA1_38_7]